jgi:hypothetical protein
MNKKLKNLQEIEKFDSWKRNQAINEAFIAAAGRAIGRLGKGLLGTTFGKTGVLRGTENILTRTYQAQRNIRDVQSGRLVPTYKRTNKAATPPQIKGKKMPSVEYANLQANKVARTGLNAARNIQNSVSGGITRAQSVMSAANRMVQNPIARVAISANPLRPVVGAALDTLANKIKNYNPLMSSAQNRKQNMGTSTTFGAQFLKRMGKL